MFFQAISWLAFFGSNINSSRWYSFTDICLQNVVLHTFRNWFQDLTQLLSVYFTASWPQHFYIAELFVSLNEYCSFLLTATLSCQILTKTHWNFKWYKDVLMTHPMFCLNSYYVYEFKVEGKKIMKERWNDNGSNVVYFWGSGGEYNNSMNIMRRALNIRN